MIKPTIGRVVWFWPKESIRGFHYRDDKQPCAALVTFVWNDYTVNLAVHDHDGNVHSFTSISLVQEGEPKPDGGFCEWMPYQIGQAKQKV